jgi:hypothetical protein
MLVKDPRFLFTFIGIFFLIVMAIVAVKSQSFHSGRTGQDVAVMEILREKSSK